MLSVSGLKVRYGDSQALFGVTLESGPGMVVTLLGRNGMGKTTTISAIMGIVPADDGEIVFRGQPIRGWAMHRIARLGIGLVPEGRQIFPNLSVRENLLATARPGPKGNRPWTLAAVLSLFPALNERLGSQGAVLSGGEQQMLAIARALMTNPDLLILDEATEGLAPLVCTEIWRVIRLLKSQGQSILLVDKNVEALTSVADRHYILEKGRVVWSGNSSELIASTFLEQGYLGL
ncbi:MAG: ABC transporter ATP-binding protein [Betaproteobacteria bacterium]|nr:ABC transporter ATP-binding protein [Betaproteobacteria bacterium]